MTYPPNIINTFLPNAPIWSLLQKQPFRGFLSKMCSENMGASCKFAAYFQNTFY